MAYLQHNVYGGDNLEILSVNRISYIYRNGKKAVDNVSFSAARGESLTIIGTNGSGKSTLLYLLNGLLIPMSGNIKIFGKDLMNGFPPEFRQKMSLLFQDPHAQLFLLSVWDELCFGPAQIGLDRIGMQKRAEDILMLLGIGHLRDRGPWDLSGGEMKKVAMGTCLSINPEILLLDEPTSGLDPRSQVEFVDLINELRNAGKTIITATHDLGIIEDISDRTIVLDENHKVLIEGRPWDIMNNTDALLHANLIHRHPHRHCWYVHEHSHFGSHDHEHVDLREEIKKKEEGTSMMTDMEKLKKLLEHWAEHNEEHANTYLEWAEKAKASGDEELYSILSEIAENTKKMKRLFEKAKKRVRTDGN